MTMSHKLVSSVLAVATGLMAGCATPTIQTNPAAQAPLAVTEDTLTRQETTLANGTGYSIQQVGSFWHLGRRCRWFWVPFRWGSGYGYSTYLNYWNRGRWVLICNRRLIPWWWHIGPFATYGARYGRRGYDITPPRLRPRFDRNRYDDYVRRERMEDRRERREERQERREERREERQERMEDRRERMNDDDNRPGRRERMADTY